MAAPKLMTVDEYLRTPETVTPMELAFGVLRVRDAPSPRHQSAVAGLFRCLDAHVRANGLGTMWLAPLDVVLDETQAVIVQPDLLFISNERSWIVSDRVRGAPDLVVEVLSPHPRIGSTEERVGWFARFGVRECWLVRQDTRDVEVLCFREGASTDRRQYRYRAAITSTVLPDFSASLADMLDAA